jgi:hypothetical protein
MQPIDESLFRAVNSRANAVLDGWMPAVEQMGRQPKLGTIRRDSDEIFPTYQREVLLSSYNNWLLR